MKWIKVSLALAATLAIACSSPALPVSTSPSLELSLPPAAIATALATGSIVPSASGAATVLIDPIRFAIDKGSPDDPQARSSLVLFYQGRAESWRIVDQSGDLVLLVPVSGSGKFGPESCVARHGGPNITMTWAAIDAATLKRFQQEWPTFRALAAGPLRAGARAELMDTGCRPE